MRNLILASAALATAVTGVSLSFSTPAFAQAGSYQRSCRNYSSSGGVLTAECADAQGRYHSSTLNTGQCRGDISNQNGMLSCPGGQASGGQLVQGQQPGQQPRQQPGQQFGQRQGDRQYGGQQFGGQQGGQQFGGQQFGGQQYGGGQRYDQGRNDRGGGGAGAAIAGVLAGALLGSNGLPATPPPAYGDPRYGDPRYDWRYTQGGWGYGHRPGEWVSVRDRADWLDMRIDRALQQGRIDRRTARDMRRQLNFIEDMEDRYQRDGRLGPRERADIDRRFDDLSARIRYEAADRGDYGDRFRGDYRGRDYDRR